MVCSVSSRRFGLGLGGALSCLLRENTNSGFSRKGALGGGGGGGGTKSGGIAKVPRAILLVSCLGGGNYKSGRWVQPGKSWGPYGTLIDMLHPVYAGRDQKGEK